MKRFFSWIGTFIAGYLGSIIIILTVYLAICCFVFLITWDYNIAFNDIENVKLIPFLKLSNGIGIVCGIFLMIIRLDLDTY